MTGKEFDRKLLPLAGDIHDGEFADARNDEAYYNRRVDEIAMLVQREYGPPLDSDKELDVQFLESLGWVWHTSIEDDNRPQMHLDFEENRRLIAFGLNNPIQLAELDKMTFEWRHLCEFSPCPTRGHLRKLHELLGIKSDV